MSFQAIVDAAITFERARERALKAERRERAAAKAFKLAEAQLQKDNEELMIARQNARADNSYLNRFEGVVRNNERANRALARCESALYSAGAAHEGALEALETAKAALDKLK